MPYRNKVFFALLSIIIANLASLAFPWVIKLVIDEVIVKKAFLLLNTLALGLVIIFILKSYLGFKYEYLSSFIGENVVCDLRNKLYWHLNKLSVHYIENTPIGKIISGVIGDVDSIKAFLFGGAIDFIYSFFSLIFIAVLLLVLDWRFGIAAILYLPIFGIAFFKASPKLKEKYSLVREKYGELTSGLNESLSGVRIVAGFALDRSEAEKFSQKQKEVFLAAVNSHKLAAMLLMSSEFLSSLGLVIFIWFGAREVILGKISIGTLMALYSYLGMLLYPVVKLVTIGSFYQEAAASIGRIKSVLTTEPKIEEIKHPVVLEKIKGEIKFEDVGFSYDNKREVLSRINLLVQAGQIVALVGKSGAGKTTLINLLLRFYDPQRGKIFIDSHNLRDLSLKDYRSQIAMVIQDDYLFSATIRENILYSRPDAPEAEIINAAKLANAHQFVVKLPLGYDTEIGERGIKLSYGQRQRISIARAILRNPAILILDEATSSLDSETERLIIEEAFTNLVKGRTTFVIAHRLSSISYVDKIIFIEDGKIAEVGSQKELLDKKSGYWKMWLSQKNQDSESKELTKR